MLNLFKYSLNLTFLIVFCLQSCEKKSRKSLKSEIDSTVNSVQSNKIPVAFTSYLRPGEKLMLGKLYTDTVRNIDFTDEGDNFLSFVKINTDTIALIFNENKADFVRGKQIENNWKMDRMRYAVDSKTLAYPEFLFSAKNLKTLQLMDKKIKFLWREAKYNDELKTEINSIVLNENYIKTISEPEKAALGYTATFVGNECEWDGEANENRSNLKCKILWALGLDYQCSYDHLNFVQTWFRNEKKILKELENCPTTPDGATIQDTFDEINLEVKSNQITVFFRASGINLREGGSWTWTEKHVFAFKENELRLLKKEISPVKLATFEVRGN